MDNTSDSGSEAGGSIPSEGTFLAIYFDNFSSNALNFVKGIFNTTTLPIHS